MSLHKITLIRPALPVKCPSCVGNVPWTLASARGQFTCPTCGHGLRLRDGYFRALYALAAVLITLVAYAMGIRSDALFATVLLGLYLVSRLIVASAVLNATLWQRAQRDR